jgi:hypothetical protein
MARSDVKALPEFRRQSRLLKVLSAVSLLLFSLSVCVLFGRRAAVPGFLWQTSSVPISHIKPEIGFSYTARHGKGRLSSHQETSPARLLENGVLLGPANSLHADIRMLGQGRFSFWYDYVYFSTSDNSDPRTNGRRYEIQAPLLFLGRPMARVLYGLTIVCCVLLIIFLSKDFPHIVSIIARLGANPYIGYALILLGASTIVVIGLAEAYPFLFAETAVQPAAVGRTSVPHACAWLLAAAVNIPAALFMSNRYGLRCPKLIRLLHILGLAITYYLLTVVVIGEVEPGVPSSWNLFYVSPDSEGYVQKYSPMMSSRPPVAPLFVQLVASGTDFKYTTGGYPRGIAQHTPNAPLLRIVRAQKIALLAASLLACYTLMGLMGPSIPALLFLGLYDFGFYTHEINHVLSEPLAQMWLLLILAAFFAFMRQKKKYLLPVGGILCAMLFLTRPAGIYSVVFPAAMILWALWSDWRAYWSSAIIAVVLLGCISILPAICAYRKSGYFYITPMYGTARIAFALQIAKPEDVSLMPDDVSRRFLQDALELKRELDAKIIPAHPDRIDQLTWLLVSNLNMVATQVKSNPGGNIFSVVSGPILREHRAEYLRIGVTFFLYATNEYGLKDLRRLHISFWFVVSACVVVALMIRGWVGMGVIALIGAHLAHLIVVSLNDAPIPRYILATEFLVVIAAFVSLWALFFQLPWKKFVLGVCSKNRVRGQGDLKQEEGPAQSSQCRAGVKAIAD